VIAAGSGRLRLKTLGALCCPECRSRLSAADPFLRSHSPGLETQHLIDGAVVCPNCSAWYPCESGLLDLRRPALQAADRRARIATTFNLEDRTSDATPDAHKSGQERFFTEEADAYERDVVQSSFYQALDDLTVHRWGAALPADSLVLDIGAGTGRVALRLAARGHHVIALDLTEALLRHAQKKAADASVEVDTLIADAENLPVMDGVLDAAVAHGVLHHMMAPALVIRHVGRALKDGGRWFSLDPHRSPVRGIFDVAMRLVPLWKEEAAPDALQTEERLLDWCGASGISASASFSCYVLPHMLAPFPTAVSRLVLRVTDALFNRSVLRNLAGVIHVSGLKGPIPPPVRPYDRRMVAFCALALALVFLLGRAWQVDSEVALNSSAYYMGGLDQTMAVANAPHTWGALMIGADGQPLEQGLDDIGYAVALQSLSAMAGPLTPVGVVRVHQWLYTAAAFLCALVVSWRFRSTVAAIAVFATLLVLGNRLAMLIYGQVSNQTITSVFPLVFLSALLWWSVSLNATRFPWVATVLVGVLAGAIDLTRHSHGLAIVLAVVTIVTFAVRGLRRRGQLALAFGIGFALITIAVPAALKLHRDVRLDRYDGWRIAYLKKPPQHHVYYTLLTAVGRYPNALGLGYEDRVVDQYIVSRSSARTAADVVAEARPLFVQYVREHPVEYVRTVVRGLGELPAFLAYTTFMAERRWTFGWPAIRADIDVDVNDAARYGVRLLMNFRYRYLRLSWWQWAIFAAAWAVMLTAAMVAVRHRGALREERVLIGGALVYLAWVALPRGLVPVQGMDFIFAFWSVSLLCAVSLWLAYRPARSFQR
jgi:SAM-dependent methyltransferase/uncharacterized protein YbaR (Trm112 family)